MPFSLILITFSSNYRLEHLKYQKVIINVLSIKNISDMDLIHFFYSISENNWIIL